MKSHVTLEQHLCPICGYEKDTGALLLDRRMRKRFEHTTTTGVSICSDCEAKGTEGFIALVGVDSARSVIIGDKIKPSDAHRTPEYLWIRRDLAVKMFNIDIESHPFVFIDPEAIAKVKEIVTREFGEEVVRHDH